jgi:hypothetical protein
MVRNNIYAFLARSSRIEDPYATDFYVLSIIKNGLVKVTTVLGVDGLVE